MTQWRKKFNKGDAIRPVDPMAFGFRDDLPFGGPYKTK